MKKIFEVLAPLFVLSLGVTHCATDSGESGSQTHWLDTCTTDAECGTGLSCECGICTETCASSSTCENLGRSATCVPPGSAAQDALCGAAPASSICLPSCRDGCQSGEACFDGACVPGATLDPDGGSGGREGSGGRSGSGGRDEAGGSGPGGRIGSGGSDPGDGGPDDGGEGGAATLCTTILPGIPTDAGPPEPSCAPYDGSCDAFLCACVEASSPGCTCTQTSETRIDLVCAAP